MFRSSVITPTVLTLKTQIGGYISTCPNPYPVLVIANDGTGLGTANSKEEYCVLWNDYGANTSLGSIYPTSNGCEFNFYGNTAPDYLKIFYAYSIQNYSFGESTISFVSDGSNGWNISALVYPTTFENLPDNLSVDSTHFDIEFWNTGTQTTIYDSDIVSDHTENTGANGAGVYYAAVTYNFSDGTSFVIYGYYLVNATNNVLKSVVISGATINSVTGLVMDISASVVQTNCAVPYAWIGVKTDNSSYVLGSGDSGTFTLQPITNKIVFLPLLENDPDFDDYDGDPTSIQTIIIS